MHDLAEGKEHQKQVGEKDMQHQHKGMSGHGHRFGQIRLKDQQTRKVLSQQKTDMKQQWLC